MLDHRPHARPFEVGPELAGAVPGVAEDLDPGRLTLEEVGGRLAMRRDLAGR